MKKTNMITNLFIVLTLMTFSFMSLASADGTSSDTKKKGSGGGDSDTGSNIAGTYFGVNGSILVLLPNGDADYFYKGWEELQHDNSWSYDEDDDKLFVYMKESAMFGSYDVEAFLNGDISKFNLVASGGTLNQARWDDETYYRYSDDTDSFTAAQCEDMIEDFVEKNPDVKTNIPEPTPTPAPTKKQTTTYQTTASTEETILTFEIPAAISYSSLGTDIQVGVNAEFEDSIPYSDTKSGYEYVVVGVICKNIGSSDYFIGSSNFQCYADNRLCDVSYIIADGIESSADVAGGREATIYFAYMVPTDASSIELEFKPNWLTNEKCIIIVK